MFLFTRTNNLLGSKKLLPLFIIGTAFAQGGVLLFMILNSFQLQALSNRSVLSVVQLQDGKSILAETVDPNERSLESIRDFVRSFFSLMFTWNTELVALSDVPEVHQGGISLDSGKKVTAASLEASFILAEDFRKSFLEAISLLTPQEIFSGDVSSQSVLVFRDVSEPTVIEGGYWSVDIVSDLIVFSKENPEGTFVPLNKKVFIKANPPTKNLLPESTTELQKSVYRVMQSGLIIVEIRDLEI